MANNLIIGHPAIVFKRGITISYKFTYQEVNLKAQVIYNVLK